VRQANVLERTPLKHTSGHQQRTPKERARTHQHGREQGHSVETPLGYGSGSGEAAPNDYIAQQEHTSGDKWLVLGTPLTADGGKNLGS